MLRLCRVVALLALACLCSGCASIVSSSVWPVTVTANQPVEFTVVDKNGVRRETRTTPATLMLPSASGFFSSQTYTFESSLGTKTISGNLNGWYFGNFIFGGLLGLLIVDPATGAMWRLPEMVDLSAPPAPTPNYDNDP